MKYFSMFSGIGGFELGIEEAYKKVLRENTSTRGNMSNSSSGNFWWWGNEQSPLCVGYSEIDKYAIAIYEYHFKHKNYGDCTKINWQEVEDFDLLAAGFPCQSFSVAGKRLGFEDTRGTLFFEIARCLKEKRPKYFILENVAGLLSNDFGRTFKTIISTLTELWYDVQWQVLNSKNFGVPQSRPRVFIVGHIRGTSRPKIFPIETTDKTYRQSSEWETEMSPTGQSSKGYTKPTSRNSRFNSSLDEDSCGVEKVLLSHTKGNIKQRIQNGKDSWALDGNGSKQAVSYAIDANYYKGSSEEDFRNKRKRQLVYTPNIRRLTPVECERLQGFPDNWTKVGIDDNGNEVKISNTRRYQCLGNAVTVNVIEFIFSNTFGIKCR